MDAMRYTIIDRAGGISFVWDCAALRWLLAGCIAGAATGGDLLKFASRRYPHLLEQVESGLAVFDEHNVDGNSASVQTAFNHLPSHQWPPFRIIDSATRESSLRQAKAGVILFNLINRRIVQIQNTYVEIRQMEPQARRLTKAGWRIVP